MISEIWGIGREAAKIIYEADFLLLTYNTQHKYGYRDANYKKPYKFLVACKEHPYWQSPAATGQRRQTAFLWKQALSR